MAYGAYVQSTALDAGTSTAAAVAFLSDLAAGNTLIVAARFNDTPGTVTCTDSRGHSFTLIRAVIGTVRLYWWVVLNSVAGADIVTVTTTNNVTINMVVAEYEGQSTLGVENGGSGTSTTPSSGTFVTGVPVALIVGVGACDAQRSFTAGASFTEREELEQRVAVEDKMTVSAGSNSATWTLSSSDIWSAVGAAFYPVGGGGGVLYMIGLNGALSPTGQFLRLASKVFNGTLTPIGVTGKFVMKSLSSSITPIGALLSSRRMSIILTGAFNFAGTIAGGIITGIGVIVTGLSSLLRRRRSR